MKNLRTFEEFLNESLLNESSAEVKKVEAFLKKKAKYDKANDLYTWNDAGVEFDVTLGRDEINLFDGENDTKVSYKEFIKSWMGESTINEGDMTRMYDGFIVYDSKDEKSYKFRYVKGTSNVRVEDAAIDKLMKATRHPRANFSVHGFVKKGEWNSTKAEEI